MNTVDKNRYRCQTETNPSFSSTLLDIIYRSIDEKDNEEPLTYRKSLARSADFKINSIRNDSSSLNFNSNNDSRYRSRLQSTECTPKPRPIRTRNDHRDNECKHQVDDLKADSNYTKTKKTKAMMKIYSYLNKGKQPISPGGRLTTFLLSLFTTTNTKKSKISSPCNGGDHDAIIHTNTKPKSKTKMGKNDSTCSSTNSGVRFYPTSMFIDESINSVLINDRLKNREIEETRKNMLRNFQKNVTKDDDDDDNVSCVSSDLFELDHLSAMQELPLYETTSIDVNRAIANGLVL